MASRAQAKQPWTRRVLPLAMGVAALALLLTLPSSLTQPQNNPSAALELAPVPPSDSKVAPTISNANQLAAATSATGLGNGSGAGVGGAGGAGGGKKPSAVPSATASAAVSASPSASPSPLESLVAGAPRAPLPTLLGASDPVNIKYHCVAGKQSADPLAPPCVDHYDGNNGGATYQGVTGTEADVIIYFDAIGTTNTARGVDTPPYDTIVDVDAPPGPDEIAQTFVNRYWERYFNETYATYNRKIHFFVQYGTYDANDISTPTTQTADASLGYTKIHPFAVINYSSFGNGMYYNNYMAQHGVVIFGSTTGREESFYQQYPGQQWGYDAPIERSASQYADAVCTQLYNKAPDEEGASIPAITDATGVRKFGLIETTDPAYQSLTTEAQDTVTDMKNECGLTIDPADIITYDHNGYTVDADTSGQPAYALNGITKLKQDNVTTILWPAGYEIKFGTVADQLHYLPELIVGDDDEQYSTFNTQFQDKLFYANAFDISSITLVPYRTQQLCFQFYRTVDPTSADSDVEGFACPEYNDLRQLFIGIQVAGPDLSPATMNQGFHAIPQTSSTSPLTPSCFYLPNDYTCVKDSVIEHWDTTGLDPNNGEGPGCWRMVQSGLRFLPGTFPKVNLADERNPADVCNGYDNELHNDTSPTG